jgi:hypothetical protein
MIEYNPHFSGGSIMPTRVLQLGKHLNYETDTYSKEKRTVNIQTSYWYLYCRKYFYVIFY